MSYVALGNFDSACTRSTSIDVKGWPKHPWAEREPLKHRMAERNKENDREQRIQPKTAAYWLDYLSDRREARRLIVYTCQHVEIINRNIFVGTCMGNLYDLWDYEQPLAAKS